MTDKPKTKKRGRPAKEKTEEKTPGETKGVVENPVTKDAGKSVTETPKRDKQSAVDFEAVVQNVANVDVGGGKSFKVLSVRCSAMPQAGLLKIIGDAAEGETIRVTVGKK